MWRMNDIRSAQYVRDYVGFGHLLKGERTIIPIGEEKAS